MKNLSLPAGLLLLLVLSSTEASSPSQFLMGGKVATMRIDVGSTESTTESGGTVWEAEHGFSGGEVITRDLPNLPAIYRSERYGDFSYSEIVPNGKYKVSLYFCETSRRNMDDARGKRSFDIVIENVKDHIKDLSREAGGVSKPLVKMYEITVRDGKLEMSFKSTPLNPADFDPACLSAVQIESRKSDKAF